MKLATLRNGTRDGQLVVVSRDLKWAMPVPSIAPTLQAALDDWVAHFAAAARGVAITSPKATRTARCRSTRRQRWRRCRVRTTGSTARPTSTTSNSCARRATPTCRRASGRDPLVYQGGSDDFIPPMADVPVPSEDYGIDLEGEVAVITDDVPMLTGVDEAAGHIKLLMLVNDWSLRNLIPAELAKGFGFYQSKPATSFSPCAITPDELGEAWAGSKVHLPLVSHINGKLFGQPNAGVDMTFDFAQLIAHVTKTRRLGAGAIIGSGTVSNYDRSSGSSCLAETRALEQIADGKPTTPFLRFGDRVRIEMFGRDGASLFGAIDQQVVQARPRATGG